MLNENFVILGAIIAALGSIKYLIETIQGRVKPNRVTFFVWALAPLIAFTAEIKQGVGIQSLMTFGVGFSPLLVFLASFVNKKSEWKLNSFDFTCGALSLVGLLFWYITRTGNIAITFSILADGLAALPTIVKSFHYPETEHSWVYLTAAISASLTLLTIDNWNFAHYGFPVYILIVCLIIFSLVQFKLGKLSKSA
ncbi:hypothetical protein KKE78_03515 [Patescibacteria group bacterium]|nr:hypothetical protein [Patescibacteria group bacterium]